MGERRHWLVMVSDLLEPADRIVRRFDTLEAAISYAKHKNREALKKYQHPAPLYFIYPGVHEGRYGELGE